MNIRETHGEEVSGISSLVSQTSLWTLTTKPTFQTELLNVQHSYLFEEKIHLLAYDPYPDGRIKRELSSHDKHLSSSGKELYMLRSENYCIFYTIQKPFVSLLALRLRESFASADGFPSSDEIEQLQGKVNDFHWEHVRPSSVATSYQQQPLPRRLTADFLSTLRIPTQYHIPLLHVQTRQALLNCPSVPSECLRRLDTSIFEQPLAQ